MDHHLAIQDDMPFSKLSTTVKVLLSLILYPNFIKKSDASNPKYITRICCLKLKKKPPNII